MARLHADSARVMWFDLETTGLDPQRDQILEIGCLVTEPIGEGLEPIDEFSMVIGVDEDVLLGMDEVVRNMHKGTGLWDEVVERGHDKAVVAQEWESFINRHFDYGREMVMVGGSGISRFDVPFVQVHFPAIAERFHWRHFDVSPVKAMANALGRSDLVPQMLGTGHRALDDAVHAADFARVVVEVIRDSAERE